MTRRNPDLNRTTRLLVLLIAVTIAVASCTGGDDQNVNERSRSSDPGFEGGTLRVVIPLHDVSPLVLGPALDPQTDWWTDSFEVFRCCLLRTLLAHPGLPTDGGGAELHPDLAAQMPEVSRDGLTWTFRLKEGIAYGPPLEETRVAAADIIRALEREAAVGSNAYAYYYSVIDGFDAMQRGEADSISGMEAPDDSTLIVHLTQPAGDLANLFAMPATAPIPPLASDPSTSLGIAEGVKSYGRSLVATGPYMIEGSQDLDLSVPPEERSPLSGYAPRRSLTLVRNPSWDRETDSLRPAYADRIEFTIGVGIETAVRMIESGQADLYLFDDPAPQVPLDVVQRYRDDPELGVNVHVEPRDLVRYITMNLAVPPLDDIHVRKAISYAVDKQAMLDIRGGAAVGDIANHILLDSMENGYLANYNPYPMSIAAARAEMALSKYDDDGDGRCDLAACRDLLMISSNFFPEMDQLAESVQKDLERIGISLWIKSIPLPESPDDESPFDGLVHPRVKVPLALFPSWSKDFLNASSFVTPLMSSRAIGSSNYSLVGASSVQLRRWGYEVTSVPGVDGRIDECLALVGDVQVRCWVETDQFLMSEVIPWVPYVFENKVFLVSDRVVAYAFDQFTSQPALDRIAVSAEAA